MSLPELRWKWDHMQESIPWILFNRKSDAERKKQEERQRREKRKAVGEKERLSKDAIPHGCLQHPIDSSPWSSQWWGSQSPSLGGATFIQSKAQVSTGCRCSTYNLRWHMHMTSAEKKDTKFCLWCIISQSQRQDVLLKMFKLKNQKRGKNRMT